MTPSAMTQIADAENAGPDHAASDLPSIEDGRCFVRKGLRAHALILDHAIQNESSSESEMGRPQPFQHEISVMQRSSYPSRDVEASAK